MGVTILNSTKMPLTVIGTNSAICYDTELKDEGHAVRIAKHCINSGHMRNLEFADITIKITCSARVAREFYTHIGGAPTRVQASTRYITYDNFDYFVPDGLTGEQSLVYDYYMNEIKCAYKRLKDLGLENDKTGYLLPLAMETTFIWKGNARTLENMFNQRLCFRALEEYRELMKELRIKIRELDEEWKWIADKLYVPKCITLGYCPENAKSCVLYKERK